MTKVVAQIWIEALCNCPHCGERVDVWEDIKETLSRYPTFFCEELDEAVECPECKEEFYINETTL